MEVENAIVVHQNAGESASEPAYVPTEAEKISGDVVIDALPYVDTEVCCSLSTARMPMGHHV